MMHILASIGFFLWSIRTILFWTGLWQIKEYRLDRLIVHLRETIQGKSLLLSPFFIITIFLILAYGLVVYNDSWTYWYHLGVFIYISIQGTVFIYEIITNTFKRPVLTPKAFIISLLAILLVTVGYAFTLLDGYLWLLLVQITVPLFVSLFVFSLSFPTELYKDYITQKAKEKRMKNKKIIVIGVSGSYGKSSTKEYIAHILSQKYSVVKTSLSENTPFAIAKTLLHDVTNDTEIFIVEMGSYKKGEVAEICEIVMPKISITTALSEQHISLYKNMENIINTEFELIHALPKDGIALFNANSPHMEKLFSRTKKKTILYGTKSHVGKRAVSLFATNIVAQKNGITFEVKIANRQLHLHTLLLGKHNVENILPAMYLADLMGFDAKDIEKAVATLMSLPKTMRKFTTQEGVVCIDDSFNASPESVIAAGQYMKLYKMKKIFVLMPLIELGKRGKEYHYTIGRELASFDYLFLTNKNFLRDILEGMQDNRGKCSVVVLSPDKIAERISQVTKKGDVVLFEGKESGKVLSKLL